MDAHPPRPRPPQPPPAPTGLAVTTSHRPACAPASHRPACAPAAQRGPWEGLPHVPPAPAAVFAHSAVVSPEIYATICRICPVRKVCEVRRAARQLPQPRPHAAAGARPRSRTSPARRGNSTGTAGTATKSAARGSNTGQEKAAARLVPARTSMIAAATRVIHTRGMILSRPRPPAMAMAATAHRASTAPTPTESGWW
jgi:hypothetical protein